MKQSEIPIFESKSKMKCEKKLTAASKVIKAADNWESVRASWHTAVKQDAGTQIAIRLNHAYEEAVKDLAEAVRIWRATQD